MRKASLLKIQDLKKKIQDLSKWGDTMSILFKFIYNSMQS